MGPEKPEGTPGKAPRKLSLGAIVALITLQNVAFAAAGMALWHWSGRDLAAMVRVTPWEFAQGLALGGALTLLAWWAFRSFPRIGERLVELQAETYRFLGRDLGWPAIVAISLAAGIGEEMLLRGGLQTWLGDHVGAPVAIVLASAVFAVIHLATPVITALLFLIGIVFGMVYWLTGSLLAVMIAHALYDVWALRYLHSEFVRLGIFDLFDDPDPEPKLANPGDPV